MYIVEVARAFPVHFPDQLRPHMRALRKARGLTQAELGALIGVSQARVAEIEAKPGLVSFEQLMKLLSVLGITVVLHEDAPAEVSVNRARAPARSKATASSGAGKVALNSPRASLAVRPKKGSW